MKLQKFITPLAMAGALLFGANAQAADAVAGKVLYETVPPVACANSGCHGIDPSKNQNKISNGRNATTIRSAINSNTGGMSFLSAVTDLQLQDIAAYIANPSAANPSPAISLSTTTLGFGSVTVGSTSAAMMVTVTNSGTAALTVSGVTVGGTNAADFVQTNNCSSVAAKASCTVNVTFKPGATGARSGSLAIAHNATGSPSSVSLSGTGASAPAPAVSLSSSTIALGSVQVGTSSAAQSVTLTNTGNAALTISGITLGGTNASDFARTGTCAAGSVAAGASCTLTATFTPSAAGARSASISVASNAPNSPHAVNLSGIGTAAPPPATPVASITPPSLSFGNVLVGASSATQMVTVANTGNAPLNVGAVTPTGPYTATGCANTAVAAGASCMITVIFKPTAAGAANGSLSIAHNAAGSPGAVALSGTGTTVTPPNGTPAISFSPMSLAFGTQKLNMPSAAQTVTLTNSGTAALSITGLSLSGTNAADFAVGGGTCAAGSSVAAGASCTAQVKFTPTAAGARSASLDVASNATGAHSVALSGTGTSDTNGLIELTQNGLVIDKIQLEDNGTHAHILIKNNSSKSIKVAKISFVNAANYQIEDQCSGRTLRPGARCEIEMEYKGPKSSSHAEDKIDAMTITTDEGATMSMPIEVKASDVAAATLPSAVADGATPKAGGGCTIGGDDQADLSQLAMLLVAAGVLVARRRKALRSK
jgi:Abnormal spindle-like microcephaly-assoc'd, ASPM-SPD-2-Hydin